MIYILAEGHGEIEALPKLAYKVASNMGYYEMHFLKKAHRTQAIHHEDKLKKEIQKIALNKPVEGLLIVRDDEDWCPKEKAPVMAHFIRTEFAGQINFPIAYHLMYREYETIFCAYLNEFRGMTFARSTKGALVFKEDITAPADAEAKRDAKGMISDAIKGNTGYKPSIDQLALTQALDIDILRSLNVPCFGTFERCIQHLKNNKGKFAVYPE